MSESLIHELPENRAEIPEGEAPPERISRFRAEREDAERVLGITHEQALARVLARFSKAKDDRRARELTWWLCTAFYLGDHYAQLNKAADALIPGNKAKVPPYRVRAKINMITPGVNELVGRMVRSMPTLSASPKTEDPKDHDAALSATAILAHEWRRADCTAVDFEARTWAAITGQGGIWTRWNQGAGALRPDGTPQGETEIAAIGPFSMYPDPDGARYSSMRWFGLAFEESAKELRSEFPELASEIGSEQVRQESRLYEDQIKSLVSASLGIPYTSAQTGLDRVTLIHHYEPRSNRFPDGLLVICTPSVVLYMGPNPWAHFGGASNRWCPVEILRYWELPGSFWGKGPVEEAIPLQKVLNRTYSQIIEQRNMTSNPKWLLPRGLRVRPGALTGGPGEEIWYTPPPPERTAGGRAYKPESVPPLPIPGALFKLMSETIARIEDLFAYHQVSKGGAPPGVRSGVAIESLQETDQGGAIPIVQRHNLAWAVVGERLLSLVREQWVDKRIIEVRGNEGYTEVRSFRGADIPSNLSVIVDSDVMLPVTRAGKLRALVEFVQLQILSPQEAREAIFGGFGTIRAAVYRASLDQKKQWRENMKMSKGVMAKVANYDNHEVHLIELNNFRKSPAFEQVKDQPVLIQGPSGQPAGMATIGDLFELHAQGHAGALLKQAQMVGVDQGVPNQQGATGEGAQGPKPGTAEPPGSTAAYASGPTSLQPPMPDSGGTG